MKKIIYLFIAVFLVSCNAQKNRNKISSSKIVAINSSCPDDGVCSFEVLKNKTFFIQSKFGNTYPEITDGNKTLLKFEYKRNVLPDTQDSHYNELIYVEIDSDMNALELKDEDLVKAKVSFGRLCFCRGQTGYYPIKSGQLNIFKNENETYSFKLSFKVNEVPQVITIIEESFKL